MASFDEEAFKKHLKDKEYLPAYFVYGDENYLKEHYVKLFKKNVVDPSFESFNYHAFFNKDTELDDILRDADVLPMMSEYNFVLVKDYPLFSSKKDIDLLDDYLKDAAESTILIFWMESVEVDERSADFKKIEKMFNKTGAVVKLSKKTESDVVRLLVNGAKKRNVILSQSNARYLIFISGNDLQVLLGELEKLCLFANGGEITKEIIDNMATKCLEANIFHLSKHIISGKTDMAYTVLNNLFFNDTKPEAMLALIANAYIDMYRVKCVKSSGEHFTDLMTYFPTKYNKRNEFVLSNAARDCAMLTDAQIRKSIDEIAAVDYQLKTSSVDEKMLFEELIAKLLLIAEGKLYA